MFILLVLCTKLDKQIQSQLTSYLISERLLRMESTTEDYQSTDIPDPEDDTVAIIVGSCLAGIVILVLIGYLIMRWKRPPQYY